MGHLSSLVLPFWSTLGVVCSLGHRRSPAEGLTHIGVWLLVTASSSATRPTVTSPAVSLAVLHHGFTWSHKEALPFSAPLGFRMAWSRWSPVILSLPRLPLLEIPQEWRRPLPLELLFLSCCPHHCPGEARGPIPLSVSPRVSLGNSGC